MISLIDLYFISGDSNTSRKRDIHQSSQRQRNQLQSLVCIDLHIVFEPVQWMSLRYLSSAPTPKNELVSSPNPTIRRILACFHFCRSPPFPHPRSRTFAPGALCGLWANLPMRTDLIQLLNFLNPMIGESSLASRPTS
jgi:hypothetical protein